MSYTKKRGYKINRSKGLSKEYDLGFFDAINGATKPKHANDDYFSGFYKAKAIRARTIDKWGKKP